MSKSIALLLVLVFLTSSYTVIAEPAASSDETKENSWTTKASMQEERAYLSVAVVNGKIYAIGGDVGFETKSVSTGAIRTTHVVNTNEEYDPDTDTWTLRASMPTARAGFGVAVYQSKIYCIGGWTGDGTKTTANEAYDPTIDNWERLAPMFTTNAWEQIANVVNNKIYVIPLYVNNSNQVYDPSTNSWTVKTPPPYEITSFSSMVVDDEIYFLGTQTNSSGFWTGAYIQVYDASNDSWRILTPSPTYGLYTGGAATTGLNTPRQFYIFEETATHVYNPANNSWSVGASMPTARLVVGVAVLDDTFYVVGGRSGQHSGVITLMYPSSINEKYTPVGYGTIPAGNNQPEPFPTELAITASGASIAVVGVGLLVYFKKRKH